MEKKDTTYAAIFKDGSFVEKQTFDEIKFFDTAKVFIKSIFHHEHITQFNNTYYYYHFLPINKDGKSTIIEYENFDIVDIGPEKGTYYASGIAFKILDKTKGIIYDFHSEKGGLKVFKNEIVPLIDKLHELGGWDNYQLYLKSEKEQRRIAELEHKNEVLSVENQQLKKELKEIKSTYNLES
jgi:hypothetical protein